MRNREGTGRSLRILFGPGVSSVDSFPPSPSVFAGETGRLLGGPNTRGSVPDVSDGNLSDRKLHMDSLMNSASRCVTKYRARAPLGGEASLPETAHGESGLSGVLRSQHRTSPKARREARSDQAHYPRMPLRTQLRRPDKTKVRPRTIRDRVIVIAADIAFWSLFNCG